MFDMHVCVCVCVLIVDCCQNLSSDQSGLQLQLQEAKDCLQVAQRTAMEQIQSQDEKLAALQKKYDACAKENEVRG
jgi:hypothetical protein